MICGLPSNGISPRLPHSSITLLMGETTYGGLVDGPVYNEIFHGHIEVKLFNKDIYPQFQHGVAVYHDDIGDYTSNEPTMDGTASLSFYLSSLEKEGIRQGRSKNSTIDKEGAAVRMDNSKRVVYLIFSADEYGEGADQILNTLFRKKIKGSFFLTGKFLRNSKFETSIRRMIAENHYVGPHSDGHLLYAPWEKRDSLLVTREQFDTDIKANLEQLLKWGVRTESVKYFLAPYEWYNQSISRWSGAHELQLINFTPGTGTNADYTTPGMKNYKSSRDLTGQLLNFEQTNPERLNGAIILIHLGTHPDRTDKFYNSLDRIIETLTKRGYSFERL